MVSANITLPVDIFSNDLKIMPFWIRAEHTVFPVGVTMVTVMSVHTYQGIDRSCTFNVTVLTGKSKFNMFETMLT